MKTITNEKKGFTLVELIVSMAILGIILSVIFVVFSYNTRLFQKSDRLSQVQFDVRMASDYLVTELRNTDSISLSDSNLQFSIDLNDLQDRYPLVTAITFEVVNQGTHYLVAYEISGNDSTSQNPYQLDSYILLNNITSANVGSGSVLYYD